MGAQCFLGLASEYSLLQLFLGELLIVMSDHLDKNHSFLGGLHLRHPIIILYEIGGKACLNDGHQIVPNITVICDMVSKLLEGRYAKYISDTTDTETCFNTTIVPLPVPALV